MERLAKYIASCGVCSRRKAEELIFEGIVRVNGDIVTDPATRVNPDDVSVKVGAKLLQRERRKVLLLNKPKGYVTTKKDEKGRKTVMDLIPPHFRDANPVGRLDKDTKGLLLLTNDGKLHELLMHPRFGVEKSYNAVVDAVLTDEEVEMLRNGVRLHDGVTQPAYVKVLKVSKGHTVVNIRIKEGRKRQVRRMIEFLLHEVLELTRISIGSLSLKGVKEGDYRELSGEEIKKIEKDVEKAKRKRPKPVSISAAKKKGKGPKTWRELKLMKLKKKHKENPCLETWQAVKDMEKKVKKRGV